MDLGRTRGDLIRVGQEERGLGRQRSGVPGECGCHVETGERAQCAFRVQTHVHRASCRIGCVRDIEGDTRPHPCRLEADEARAAFQEQLGVFERQTAPVHHERNGHGALGLFEPAIGAQVARVLRMRRALVRDQRHIGCSLLRRVGGIGVDIEAHIGAHRCPYLVQRLRIGVETLAALDLQGPEAVTLDHLGRFPGHRKREGASHGPRHGHFGCALPELPQRHALRLRAQIPARAVDEPLREPVLREGGETLAHGANVREVHALQRRQQHVLEHRDERPACRTGPGRLDRPLGDAFQAVIRDEPQQHQLAAFFHRIFPVDGARVGQPDRSQGRAFEVHVRSPCLRFRALAGEARSEVGGLQRPGEFAA